MKVRKTSDQLMHFVFNLVLEKVRSNLNSRGVKTIRGMGRSFRIMDDNGDRKIDKQEFYWGLQDLGAAVSKNEAQLLLEYLDTN